MILDIQQQCPDVLAERAAFEVWTIALGHRVVTLLGDCDGISFAATDFSPDYFGVLGLLSLYPSGEMVGASAHADGALKMRRPDRYQ